MGKSVRVFSVAAISVASVFVGLSSPAGASHALRLGVATVARPAAALPNSNIKGAGATLAYKPAKLKATWGAATQQPQCTADFTSFTITNPTKKTVSVLNGTKVFAKVKPNFILSVCTYGSGKATGVFGLKGSSNTLTFKLS